jgi:hypothetical protein
VLSADDDAAWSAPPEAEALADEPPAHAVPGTSSVTALAPDAETGSDASASEPAAQDDSLTAEDAVTAPLTGPFRADGTADEDTPRYSGDADESEPQSALTEAETWSSPDEAEDIPLAARGASDPADPGAAAPPLPAEETSPPASPPGPEPARIRFTRPEDDAAALDRLLLQTDAQMSGPDAIRRRAAIAQMRAAVAASAAAREAGEAPAPASPAPSRTAQPRRPPPVAVPQRGERPRAAPLRLVASQRIDLPDAAEPVAPPPVAQPIRPRRVTLPRHTPAAEVTPASSPAPGKGEADSFAAFAAAMGAGTLADLIEAAAAHTIFVEGMEDFSRPQVLHKVSEISPDSAEEERLRLFGTLLREGRIRRSTRAGRFEIARDTRFDPARQAP